MVLDLCHGEQPADDETIQTHLDRMKAPAGSPIDHDVRVKSTATQSITIDTTYSEYIINLPVYVCYFGGLYFTDDCTGSGN